MPRPAWYLAALLASSITAAPAQEAPAPAEPPTGPTADRPSRNLGEVLREPAELTLTPGVTIGEVVRGLAERHGARIEFVSPELADRPIGRLRNEVTLKGVPFDVAIGYAVAEAGLARNVRDGVFVIGERDALRIPPAGRIRAALGQQTQLEFPRTPLRDAIRFLADLHEINVIVDEPTLTDAGVNVDDEVDVVLSGIRLADALDILLAPKGLTYVTANDVLLVTTDARAAREIDTRAYDVAAIVGEAGYAAQAGEVVTELLEPRSMVANAMIAAEGKPPVPLPQPRIVPFKQKLLVTASWADQRRVEEILKLIEGTEK